MNWTKDLLYDLRNEISLCSLFTNDYNNSYGVEPHSCMDFFDSYADYLGELMVEDNIDADAFFENLDDYDTDENLWNWFNCYEADPFVYEEE